MNVEFVQKRLRQRLHLDGKNNNTMNTYAGRARYPLKPTENLKTTRQQSTVIHTFAQLVGNHSTAVLV